MVSLASFLTFAGYESIFAGLGRSISGKLDEYGDARVRASSWEMRFVVFENNFERSGAQGFHRKIRQN